MAVLRCSKTQPSLLVATNVYAATTSPPSLPQTAQSTPMPSTAVMWYVGCDIRKTATLCVYCLLLSAVLVYLLHKHSLPATQTQDTAVRPLFAASSDQPNKAPPLLLPELSMLPFITIRKGSAASAVAPGLKASPRPPPPPARAPPSPRGSLAAPTLPSLFAALASKHNTERLLSYRESPDVSVLWGNSA